MTHHTHTGTMRALRVWATALLFLTLSVTFAYEAYRTDAQMPEGPVFQSLTISGTTIATGGTVTITARITDAYSDIGEQPSIAYRQPNGDDGPFAFFSRISGTPRDGTYEAVVPISPFYPAGTYPVKEVRAFDIEGKVASLIPPTAPTTTLALNVSRSTAPRPTTAAIAATSTPTPRLLATITVAPRAATIAPAPAAAPQLTATTARPTDTPRPAAPPPATATPVRPATATVGTVPPKPSATMPPAPAVAPVPTQPAPVIAAEFRDITLSGDTVAPGSTVGVTVHIVSKIEITNYPLVIYTAPSGNPGPLAYLTRIAGDGRDGTYHATLFVSRNAAAGLYTLRELRATGTDGSDIIYIVPSPPPPDGAFTVKR